MTFSVFLMGQHLSWLSLHGSDDRVLSDGMRLSDAAVAGVVVFGTLCIVGGGGGAVKVSRCGLGLTMWVVYKALLGMLLNLEATAIVHDLHFQAVVADCVVLAFKASVEESGNDWKRWKVKIGYLSM